MIWSTIFSIKNEELNLVERTENETQYAPDNERAPLLLKQLSIFELKKKKNRIKSTKWNKKFLCKFNSNFIFNWTMPEKSEITEFNDLICNLTIFGAAQFLLNRLFNCRLMLGDVNKLSQFYFDRFGRITFDLEFKMVRNKCYVCHKVFKYFW